MAAMLCRGWVAMILLSLVGCSSNPLYRNRHFVSDPIRYKTVVVLEPEFHIVEASIFTGKKDTSSDNQFLIQKKSNLVDSIATLLTMNGFSPRLADESDLERFGVRNLKLKESEISERVFSGRKTRITSVAGLTDEPGEIVGIGFFNTIAVDAIAYSSYKRTCKSEASQIAELAILLAIAGASGNPAPSARPVCNTTLEIVLFDATSKEILFANRATLKSPSVELIAEKAFEKLPKVVANW